ncbi:MAG: hypothetical protein ACLVJX_02640 [Merdibacter sp.]
MNTRKTAVITEPVVDVDHEKQHWELLLNEGNHWLGMIRACLPASSAACGRQGNIWYQMDGQAPSQEGLAVVKDGEVHADILLAWGEQKKGSITLEAHPRKRWRSAPAAGNVVSC